MADLIIPSLDQKLFLVISVAIATVSFFINAIQIITFLYHDLLHNIKNTLLLTQAIAGLITTFTVVYPIKLITAHSIYPIHFEHNFFNDFSVCYFIASGFLLISIFSTVTNFTIMVLEQFLSLVHPKLAIKFQTDFMLVTACITIAWMETVLLAMAPWLGWNQWDDTSCQLPDVWPIPFTALIIALYFIHLGVIAAMFLKIWLAVRRRSYIINPDSEELPVTSTSNFSVSSTEPLMIISTNEAKLRFIAFLVHLTCHLPILLHLINHANCNHYKNCSNDTSQKVTAFIWTSLLLIVNSAISPLIYVFTDEQLTKHTIWFLKLCCCHNWCKLHNNAISPDGG